MKYGDNLYSERKEKICYFASLIFAYFQITREFENKILKENVESKVKADDSKLMMLQYVT